MPRGGLSPVRVKDIRVVPVQVPHWRGGVVDRWNMQCHTCGTEVGGVPVRDAAEHIGELHRCAINPGPLPINRRWDEAS